jgi:hypothetical protein
MLKDQKIYLCLGFHVNYNHSYRGDRNDDTGFGYDSVVIRGIVDILNRANRRGLDARGTWDFDHFWSVQHCMKRFAPELLDAIAHRIKDGPDEAIIDNWNNGSVAWMTRDELRISVERAISNPWGSGARDLFGKYSPVIRSQETMFTHGAVPVFKQCGLKAICMFYSAVPFDALRNFVPRLSPNERYNPLKLNCPVSGEDFLVMPMYSQGDILDNLSLEMWLEKIRKHQKQGLIPGNAMVYINMDADAKLWTGLGLPRIFDRVPNTRGLDEYIEVVNRLDFVEFGTLGDYIDSNPPVGEIRIDLDTADGSHTGFNSWSEKWINYPLWTLHQHARRMERAAEALLGSSPAPDDHRAQAAQLLYGGGLSNLECRIRAASTTHFGLAAPTISPERLRVAFHFARSAGMAAETALNTLLHPMRPPALQPHEAARFSLIQFHKYEKDTPPPRAETPVFAPLPEPGEGFDDKGLCMIDDQGGAATFDILDTGADEGDREKAVVFIARTGGADPLRHYTLLRTGDPARPGLVQAKPDLLTNGLVVVRLNGDGFVTSVKARGREFAATPFFNPGVTYRVRGRDAWCAPRRCEVEPVTGRAARFGGLRLDYEFPLADSGHHVSGSLFLHLLEGLPYLYVSGCMELPLTECRDVDNNVSTRIGVKYDKRWIEVAPVNLRPGLRNLQGKYLKIWKHNYQDVTHAYELNWGAIDPGNRNVSSFNNHVTDGWVAAGNGECGLVVAHDQAVNTAPASCPMRLRERAGQQTLTLNPFGTYHGEQLTHLPDGTGVARELAVHSIPHCQSTAPSYNGRAVYFSLMLAFYEGDAPPAQVQNDAAAFSMPPVLLQSGESGYAASRSPEHGFALAGFDPAAEFNLDAVSGWDYGQFLELANRAQGADKATSKQHDIPKLPFHVMRHLVRDMFRATFKISG